MHGPVCVQVHALPSLPSSSCLLSCGLTVSVSLMGCFFKIYSMLGCFLLCREIINKHKHLLGEGRCTRSWTQSPVPPLNQPTNQPTDQPNYLPIAKKKKKKATHTHTHTQALLLCLSPKSGSHHFPLLSTSQNCLL